MNAIQQERIAHVMRVLKRIERMQVTQREGDYALQYLATINPVAVDQALDLAMLRRGKPPKKLDGGVKTGIQKGSRRYRKRAQPGS